MKLQPKTALASAVLSLALTAPAMAGPIVSTVDVAFPGGSGLFPAGSVTTGINYNNGPGGTQHSSRVRAGMFGGTASNGVNFDETTLFRNANDVLAYCIDILNNLLRKSNTYQVNTIEQNSITVDDDDVRRDFGRTLRFLGAVNAYTRDQFDYTAGSENWLNPHKNWVSGAIQVGIWESLYEAENASLSTSDGWFTAGSLGNKGNQFLDATFDLMASSDAPDALDASRVKWLQIDGGQDLIVDPVDVPAPASLLLVVGGLALLRRRGSQRANA